MHHKWSGDSLLVSIDSGRSFAVHSRLPGKITSVDTSGEVYYAQIGDSAVYRFPLDARSVRSTPARTRVSISPNPSQGLVRLKALFPESIKRVYVTTMIGTEIAIDGIREITSTNEFELDLRNLPSGSYLLHVVTESNEYIEKLIKQ